MKIHKFYIFIGLIIAMTLFAELAAHADDFDLATRLTFSQPVEIPGQALPPGTYLFKLADTGGSRGIVQIFNADGTHIVATVMTIAAERREPASDTVVTLAERESGNPDAFVKWFYPGRTIGNEFVYPKKQEQEVAHDKQDTFVGDRLLSSSDAGLAG